MRLIGYGSGPEFLMRGFLLKALIPVLLILTFVPSVFGRDYMMRRKADGCTVDIIINRNPPIVGVNDIRVGVRDSRGEHVPNLSVSINYYMPPMPGMPPMNYTVKASPRGSEYGAAMNLIMTGPWNIVIKTRIAGKEVRTSVPIDVR
jgi:hypothetical protein